MRKKGQIYLIAAIILAAVIFVMTSVLNIAKQDKFRGDFEKLSQNYDVEGARLVNTVIQAGEDVGGRFGNFTYIFTGYSKTQNSQFGLIYVLGYKGMVYIGNYLPEDIYVVYVAGANEEQVNLTGCFDAVGASVSFGPLTRSFESVVPEINMGDCVKEIEEPSDKMLHVAIGSSWYPFKVIEGKPQLMVVSKMEQEGQRKVFVGGEGFVQEENYCSSYDNEEKCKKHEKICEWHEGICEPKEEGFFIDCGSFRKSKCKAYEMFELCKWDKEGKICKQGEKSLGDLMGINCASYDIKEECDALESLGCKWIEGEGCRKT